VLTAEHRIFVEHEKTRSAGVNGTGTALTEVAWVARNDRSRSFDGHRFSELPALRASLPLQFDDATNKTIELIDVLWLSKNSIVAAFDESQALHKSSCCPSHAKAQASQNCKQVGIAVTLTLEQLMASGPRQGCETGSRL
jgi:hypothetical protein